MQLVQWLQLFKETVSTSPITIHNSLLTILTVGAGGAMDHQESFFVILIPCGARPAGGGRRILLEVVRTNTE